MVVVAFTVDKDSDFAKRYIETKLETQCFRKLANEFFKKYDLLDSQRYYKSETLAVELTEEQREKFSDQLKKNPNRNGFYVFKAKSKMQKEWEEEVAKKVDFKILDQMDLWYFDYIHHGAYALWDYEGVIYGCLESRHQREISLPDYFKQIKLSEYYAVIEKAEEKNNE